jgi:putative transposase
MNFGGQAERPALFIYRLQPVELRRVFPNGNTRRAKQKTTRYAGGVLLYRQSPVHYNKGAQAKIMKGQVIAMAQKANSLAHTKWLCKYHIVFTPKYRRKIIYNQYKEDLRDILKQLCAYKGVTIIEGHLMPDHVHMLVSIPPKYSVSTFMGYLKGKSALMMFDRHANLKYKFGNRHFWSEGYYVSTVGMNEATIKKYIQDQEKQDIIEDKLSVKEYEDPFKGQR